jgi:hypothetical protein
MLRFLPEWSLSAPPSVARQPRTAGGGVFSWSNPSMSEEVFTEDKLRHLEVTAITTWDKAAGDCILELIARVRHLQTAPWDWPDRHFQPGRVSWKAPLPRGKKKPPPGEARRRHCKRKRQERKRAQRKAQEKLDLSREKAQPILLRRTG